LYHQTLAQFSDKGCLYNFLKSLLVKQRSCHKVVPDRKNRRAQVTPAGESGFLRELGGSLPGCYGRQACLAGFNGRQGVPRPPPFYHEGVFISERSGDFSLFNFIDVLD